LRPAPHQAGLRCARSPPLLTPSPLSAKHFTAGLALLGAGLAALLLPYLGLGPLARAEIYFLDAARGMVESGDWLVPRYEGRPFFDKPILSYWLMAAAMDALGTTPAAARLVPVLASLGLVFATAWLGTLLFDRRTALAAALVLATTLGFLSFARVAMSDMPLALLSTLAVALAVLAYQTRVPGLVVPLLGAVAGLGFATKGPIAVLIPGIAILLLLFKKRGRPVPGGVLGIAIGALAFAVLGFGWFGLVYQRLGAEPLAYFFLRENLQRFAAETYDIGRPIWFYVPAYLAEGLPWSPFLPIALARLLRSADPRTRTGARFLSLWPLVVLVLLSLSRGKLDYYLLPLYPAVSLLLGRYLAVTPWLGVDRAWARVVLLAEAAALALVLLRPPQVPAEWLPGAVGRGTLVAVLALGVLALLAAAARPAHWRVLAAPAAVVAAGWLCAVVSFLPAFSARQPNAAIVKDVARERRYRPDLRMAYCSDPTRVRRDVLLDVRLAALAECDLWSLAGSREPFLLLVTPAENASFRVDPRYRHIATYRYLPAEALTFGGLFSLGAPGEVMLGANFATRDPVAVIKKKREYRKMLDRAAGLSP
jgi:4-amino-4-deoxy-L-arabinose transferase-like glycosyltransferase